MEEGGVVAAAAPDGLFIKSFCTAGLLLLAITQPSLSALAIRPS